MSTTDQPVSIDINPAYNADQLAAEVERAINAAYGDDRKFQVEQNIDDTITLDFQRVGADGSVSTLTNKVAVELLGTDSYVTEAMAAGATLRFLAHRQTLQKRSFWLIPKSGSMRPQPVQPHLSG
ncbi:MAG: hypothetical protein CM15mP60_1540 [Alphaproteobacteria bacterium]|nr:MAG: hypothetical protein CM15mP60_1540 [Alphaproteobacteria bacterium]